MKLFKFYKDISADEAQVDTLSDNAAKKTYISNVHNRFYKKTDNNYRLGQNRFTSFFSKVEARYKRRKSQFRTLLLFSILLICGFTSWAIKANAMHKQDLQEGIAQEIIRFHVLANSDSDADQVLKLTVKDTLVKNLAPILKDTGSITEARNILASRLTYIQELAEETILANGYAYPVTVNLEQCYFPLKVYGDYTFPPGNYEALRVQIGEAKGKNWWCVMFPPLCFVDETYSIVDESSGEKLKYLLTEEEYNTITNKKTPVKVKFKLLEAIKKLFR